MKERRSSRAFWGWISHVRLLTGLGVIIRVTLALILWLVLFLGIFLGYFTIPILLISAITLVYTVLDVGLFMTVRRREQARKERETFLRTQRGREEIDTLD